MTLISHFAHVMHSQHLPFGISFLASHVFTMSCRIVQNHAHVICTNNTNYAMEYNLCIIYHFLFNSVVQYESQLLNHYQVKGFITLHYGWTRLKFQTRNFIWLDWNFSHQRQYGNNSYIFRIIFSDAFLFFLLLTVLYHVFLRMVLFSLWHVKHDITLRELLWYIKFVLFLSPSAVLITFPLTITIIFKVK